MPNPRSSLSIRMMTLAVLAVLAAAAPGYATYSLVWSDEFNGSALDAASWTPDIGNGCPSLCGWGNGELQYYRAQNVTVSGGNLVLTTLAQSYAGSAYTSGKITTRGKRTFRYGRIEMRAKLPTGGGMWPAFWMMPQDDVYGGWAASGEIDIMESANATTSVGGALHYGGSWPANTSTSNSVTQGGANFADAFHLYAVEWEPDAIRWYVDGALFMTRTSAQWYSATAPDNPRAPFDQDFYLILNAAVGGYYTGCTSTDCVTASFPQQYLIDYVRVYQDIANEAPTVALTAPAPGATLPAGDITLTATAADSDGAVAKVEFYNGATWLGEDATAPYAFIWAGVGDGCYEIIARALDDLGGTATDGVEITVGAGCGQAAYAGSPFVVPARIEAEDFDLGGAGVAYHDSDAGNSGGQYRIDEDVDLEACGDAGGGYGVGWIVQDEWLEYSITVPAAGDYPVEVRVASLTGGSFHLEFDGADGTGAIVVPATGSWQAWTTVSATASLAAGPQIMRFVADTSGFNVNYFEFPWGPSAVLPDPGAAGARLLACYPNPFNPRTVIRYELDRTEHVQLTVFDLRGRLVKTLCSGIREPGRHEEPWNGRDESGQAVASGTYFYRLEAGGVRDTRRMVLVK